MNALLAARVQRSAAFVLLVRALGHLMVAGVVFVLTAPLVTCLVLVSLEGYHDRAPPVAPDFDEAEDEPESEDEGAPEGPARWVADAAEGDSPEKAS